MVLNLQLYNLAPIEVAAAQALDEHFGRGGVGRHGDEVLVAEPGELVDGVEALRVRRVTEAEDEVDLAEALTVFFEKNHFSVDAVHNGFDAYEYASSGAYDAVILDVMMPKMDGWQVCREIRKKSQCPIIMLTARSEERDELQGFELGVDEYISKPFSPKILVARVNAIFCLLYTSPSPRDS